MALEDVLAALVTQPQVMPAVPAPFNGFGYQPEPLAGMGFTELAANFRPKDNSFILTGVPKMREGGGGGRGTAETIATQRAAGRTKKAPAEVYVPGEPRASGLVRPAPVPAQAKVENPRAVIGSNSGAPITRTTTGGDLSGIKYRIPLEEMSATVSPSAPMLSRPLVTPESLYRDRSLLMGMVGDRTATGVTLTDIGGNPLSFKVPLYGGPGYMQGEAQQLDQAIWAAAKGKIATIGKKALEAAKKGPVDLIYTAMGGQSGDFSTMMSDALAAQLPGAPISEKLAEDFDAAMGGKIRGWPGVKSPDLASFLRGNPKARVMFAQEMDKAPYQDGGFPNVAQTRFGISEPELVHAPTGTTGFSLGRFDADNPWVTNPTAFHPTYTTGLRGTNSGQLDMPYPRELIWPDWYSAARQNPGLKYGQDQGRVDYAFERQLPVQEANQQWLDQIKEYQELQAIRGY